MKFLLAATLLLLTVYGSTNPFKDQGKKFDSLVQNEELADCDCTDSISNKNSKQIQTEDSAILIEGKNKEKEFKNQEPISQRAIKKENENQKLRCEIEEKENENKRLRSKIEEKYKDYSELVEDVKKLFSKQQKTRTQEITQEKNKIKNLEDIISKQQREIRKLNSDVATLEHKLYRHFN